MSDWKKIAKQEMDRIAVEDKISDELRKAVKKQVYAPQGTINSLTKQQVKNIMKYLVGNNLKTGRKKIMGNKKEPVKKTKCFHCQEVINKRERNFIEVVKRNKISIAQCPRLCFHVECWTEAAGDNFEIK